MRRRATPVPLVAVESPALPRGPRRARPPIGWPPRVAGGTATAASSSRSTAAASWCAAGALVRDPPRGRAGRRRASRAITSSGELATHARRITEAYENYSQLRVLKRPLAGHLPVAVPDDDADDSGQRDLDRVCIWPSGSPGRCSCSPPARARSAPATSITASSRRPATSSARWSRRSTRWPASWRRASASSSTRGSISSARTCSSTSAAATSRPCSSGLPPASCRSAPTARDRDDQQRGAAAARRRPRGHRRAAPRTCSQRDDLQPLEPLLRAGAQRRRRRRRRRRSRSCAKAASCTWPRPRRRSSATTAASRARCWCSTT